MIFPLSWEDFGICPRDVNVCVKTSSVMCVRDITAEGVFRPGAAVVRALRLGISGSCEPERDIRVGFHDDVLLLKGKPWFLVGDDVEDLLGFGSEISVSWSAITSVGIAQRDAVHASTKWTFHNLHWLDEDFTVMTSGLIGARTIVSPVG